MRDRSTRPYDCHPEADTGKHGENREASDLDPEVEQVPRRGAGDLAALNAIANDLGVDTIELGGTLGVFILLNTSL